MVEEGGAPVRPPWSAVGPATRRRAAAAGALLLSLAGLLLAGSAGRGGRGGGAGDPVVLQQAGPGSRGRVDPTERVRDPALRQAGSGQAGGDSYRSWHLAHAPSDKDFSVMHAKVYESRPAERDEGERDDEDGEKVVRELDSRANALKDRDTDQLAKEGSALADSKQYVMGAEEAMTPEEREKRNRLEDEEVDRRERARYDKERALRAEGRSEVEQRSAAISQALANAYQARIAQHKRELTAEQAKSQEVRDEDRAHVLEQEAAEAKAKALRDARLAGVLDDRADQDAVVQKRSQEEEKESVMQLQQLDREVKRAEEEARRARQHAHELRHGAAQDVAAAQGALAQAEKLILEARRDRGEAEGKRTEIARAKLALNAAQGVEKSLAVRAAQYTGQAKLDLLQSGLLRKAAQEHEEQARKDRHAAEKEREGLEGLKVKEQRSLSNVHEARVRVRRVHDRIQLDRERAKRRLERVQHQAVRAGDAYKEALNKQKADAEASDSGWS